MATLEIVEKHPEDYYSDGEQIEQEISQYVKAYSSDDYDQILEEDQRWPVFYHLTDMREGILNWYDFKPGCDILEIGAGMGALTGLLCRKAGTVTSVELSYLRASVIHERCKQYDNLQILVGNFNRMNFTCKYDYITLIGVLEYAPSFTPGGDPARFLDKIQKLLKPNGKLLIAIENRFGLKYWCGASEDHIGKPYSGINGYVDEPNIRTYSHNELKNLLSKCGLVKQRFFYCLPDYKFPQVVYSDEYCPTDINIGQVKQYYADRRPMPIREGPLYKDVLDNGALSFMANSYLVECGSENAELSTIGCVVLTPDRIPEKRVVTVIRRHENTVEKIAATCKGNAHLSTIIENQKWYTGNNLEPYVPYGDRICMPFLEGERLDHVIRDHLLNHEIKDAVAWIERFYDSVKKSSEVASQGKDPLMKHGFLDLNFQNCIVKNGNLTFFDQEWVEDNIPASYILFRAISLLIFTSPDLQKMELYNTLLDMFGIDSRMRIAYEKQDQHLSKLIFKVEGNPLKILEDYKANEVAALVETAQYQTSFYFDFGSGYSEKHRLSFMSAGNLLDLECDVPEGCKKIRFDPVDGFYCVVKNLSITSNKGFLPIQNLNGETWEALEIFQTTDPQMEIVLTGPITKLRLRAEISVFEDPLLLKLIVGLSDTDKERTTAAEAVANLKEERILLDAKLAEAEESVRSQQNQISALEEAVANLKEERILLDAKLAEAEESVRSQQNQMSVYEEDLSSSAEALQAANDRIEEQEKQITNLTDRLSLNRDYFCRQILEFSRLAQTIPKLEEMISGLQAEKSELSQQVKNTQNAYSTVINSTAWKMTGPARYALDSLKEIRKSTANTKELPSSHKEPAHVDYPSATNEFLTTCSAVNCLSSFHADGLDKEPNIPEGWIEIQKETPLMSIVIAAKSMDKRANYLRKALSSLTAQKYKKIEVILISADNEKEAVDSVLGSFKEQLLIIHQSIRNCDNRWAYWEKGAHLSNGELIGFLEQEDILTENALAYILEAYNESKGGRKFSFFLLPYAHQTSEGQCICPDYKRGAGFAVGGVQGLLHFGMFERRHYLNRKAFEDWLLNLKRDAIFVSPWIGCLGSIVDDIWLDRNAKFVAFYLPQFHEIPENNNWWGKGFTEWSNVKKAKPLYPGHDQPRIPTELGYYDLGDKSGLEIQKKQIALAKQYGLSGFCYYYYWFDGGKRLLEKPLDRHLQDKSLDFPFCLCWANENWTRQWDGLKSSVLMSQTYSPGWAELFALDIIPYFRDERYIRINGAPYLLIYNIDEIPDARTAITVWRNIAAQYGFKQIHISAVRRSLEASEFERSGFTLDSLTDFPPHLVGTYGVDADDGEVFGLGPGQVKDYRKAVRYHAEMPKQPFTYFRTAMLNWDNTARRGEKAYIFEHFSISEYKKWLYSAKEYALWQNRPGEDLVFINAWNEWAEGTYLEPSKTLGREALEATAEILKLR